LAFSICDALRANRPISEVLSEAGILLAMVEGLKPKGRGEALGR
jgi:hypothetical protein